MKFPDWLRVRGDQAFRGDCPSETAEQLDFFGRLRVEFPELALCALHPRNEGKRTAQQARRESHEGMVTGAPDIVIVGQPCVVIELKRRDHTKSAWQKNQQEVLRQMHDAGALVYVALGSDAAMAIVRQHY